MTIRIGVIGTGAIGREHIHRCDKVLQNSTVVAVNDINVEAVDQVVKEQKLKAKIYADGHELIKANDVDAVLVTAIGDKHEEFVLAALEAKKPVFCEKPMAPTAEACKHIVDAETKCGKRLVQVGFMRPFDLGYLALKKILDSKTLGEPLIVNCRHFNYTNVSYYTTDMAINDTFIHEIDVLRWLLGDDYESVQVFFPRRSCNSPEKVGDPQIVIVRTKKNVIVNAQLYVFTKYAYDVQCEVIGEHGIAALPEPVAIPVLKDGQISHPVLIDWKTRFIDAYDVELQAFVDNVSAGKFTVGASAWDGYAAAVAADACVRAQKSGKVETIEMPPKPSFYNK